MLRPFSLAIALLAVAGGAGVAAAQEADAPPVDFMLRPTQDALDEDSDDDIWTWDTEPGPSLLDSPIGPDLAGPTGEELTGPPLAGPTPELPEIRDTTIERTDDEDEFAQRGINLGAFVIRPSIEIGGIATDNGGGTRNKQSAVALVVEPEINVRAETERYQFEANGRGEGIFYDREEFDAHTVEARAKLRYSLTTHTAFDAEAGFAQFLEGFSDPETPTAAAERPAVDNLHAALGAEQSLGQIGGRLSAFVDRSVHEDVPLSGGGIASRKELNNTEFGMRFRAGYATDASLRPFAEVAVARREFDQEIDDSGFARSSLWGELRGGIVVDRGEKLTGEISLGYRREDIEDDRLEDLNVFLANAAILWSPRRLTEVKIDFTTQVVPTSIPDASASILYSGALILARNLTPRIRGETGIALSYETRVGDDFRDVTFAGFAGLSYAFTPTASLVARYEYERTDRNETDGDFDAHTVGVRIRLQR